MTATATATARRPDAAAAPAEDVIEVQGMAAGYDGAWILEDIGFTARRGEVLGVLGRNGVGKSTLVNGLLNLGPTVTGRVLIKGRDVVGWPTHRIVRLGIGIVPQGRGIFGNLTVEDNLRLALFGARATAANGWTLERVYDSFAKLGQRRHVSASALSGGERQLLAMSRALLTQADILILDEPTEGLAPMVVEEVIVGNIRSLRREGVTVILVEQNIALALDLADQAIVLSDGGIVFCGSADTLKQREDIQNEYLGV
ncbi:ABC transporter ATP-binding protein [Azospirillum sp. RWY-5-1]|uniref:ABC transporter ATP-binding protein n=1 Tax=Azospirillum oleiclasticum TaxID=2735135 RepID=A0ABX2T2H0_9PROT|nr:ABC transporter ATP-binding protein [Azospirillum oleiclasticum]NYZ11287.1 ABC transporter ATP-binding protein [Azospirillum oleiclasticum]NYZ18448.1 ABC transporter ATP-binding protein [Azospirillum oleiclasticum]